MIQHFGMVESGGMLPVKFICNVIVEFCVRAFQSRKIFALVQSKNNYTHRMRAREELIVSCVYDCKQRRARVFVYVNGVRPLSTIIKRYHNK